MKKVKERFFKYIGIKTIRNQMFVVQSIIILITMLIGGGSIYTITCKLLKERSLSAYEQILAASDGLLEKQLSYYEGEARKILASDILQGEFANHHGTTDAGRFIEPGLTQKLHQALRIYISSYTGINSIYLFDVNGAMAYIDYGRNTGQVTQKAVYKEILDSDWYQEAVTKKGKEIFVGYNVIFGSINEFSLIKILYDVVNLEPIGLMVINIDCKELESIFSANSEDEGIYALTRESEYGEQVIYQQGNESGEDLDILLRENTGGYTRADYKNERTGWRLIHIISEESIVEEAGIIRNVIGICLLISLLFMMFATSISASKITRPLYQLRDNIIRVGEGERIMAEISGDNEISTIGQSFNRMVSEKLILREKITQAELNKKEAELELLQSQINPHFLYNTLDALYWMAVVHETPDIAEMTRALSEIFRISLNKGKEFICVKEELSLVEDYLTIQNMRFANRFMIQISVDEKVQEMTIIKLILQPFVENAIYHGLEPKKEQGLIFLRGKIQNDKVCFTITDNGIGMDVKKDIEKGYAIRNVMERLKLTYGEEARVVFESSPGQGTTVKLYIPYEKMAGGKGHEAGID